MSLANISEKQIKALSIGALVIAVIVGVVYFYNRYAYIESGHGYLFMGYLLVALMLMVCVNFKKMPLVIVSILLLVAILVYSGKKFDWRQNYIQMAEAGQPFFLEEFIETYPTFEQYNFNLTSAPDWVRFNDECVQPALLEQVVSPRCATIDLISRWYNIDPISSMSGYFQKMRTTAAKIKAGEMKKRSEYAECIARKECATIPLLPKGVDANMLTTDSREYIGIRQAYWSLINDDKMSQEVCALTPLCRALVNMKAVNQTQLPF